MEVKVAKSAYVEKVIRDDFGDAIWAKILYVDDEKKEILHDVIFMPDNRKWVYIKRRVIDNFLPPKRFFKMAEIAAAIFYEK